MLAIGIAFGSSKFAYTVTDLIVLGKIKNIDSTPSSHLTLALIEISKFSLARHHARLDVLSKI